MKGKVCLVTGANSGIGRATASGLARLGATVVLACRDRERGEAARAAISSETGNPSVELVLVDLSQQASIRSMATAFVATHGRLDVLVNGAAIFTAKRSTTSDGFETMFATNHLGPFLLTNLLLGALKASAPARVITLTAPSTVPLDFGDLQGQKRFNALRAFGATKMANLLFTYELARRLEPTGVTANAVHPGVTRSNLMKEAPLPIRWFSYLLSASPEKAADTPIYLASSPDVAGITGKFFKDRKVIESNQYSRDEGVQRHLWGVSAALVGLV